MLGQGWCTDQQLTFLTFRDPWLSLLPFLRQRGRLPLNTGASGWHCVRPTGEQEKLVGQGAGHQVGRRSLQQRLPLSFRLISTLRDSGHPVPGSRALRIWTFTKAELPYPRLHLSVGPVTRQTRRHPASQTLRCPLTLHPDPRQLTGNKRPLLHGAWIPSLGATARAEEAGPRTPFLSSTRGAGAAAPSVSSTLTAAAARLGRGQRTRPRQSEKGCSPVAPAGPSTYPQSHCQRDKLPKEQGRRPETAPLGSPRHSPGHGLIGDTGTDTGAPHANHMLNTNTLMGSLFVLIPATETTWKLLLR